MRWSWSIGLAVVACIGCEKANPPDSPVAKPGSGRIVPAKSPTPSDQSPQPQSRMKCEAGDCPHGQVCVGLWQGDRTCEPTCRSMDDCPADRPYCVVTKVTLGEDTVTNAMLCRADTRSESKKADLLSECKETSTARLPQERPVYATLTLQGVTIPAANKWLGDQGIVSHEAIRNMYIVELPEGEEVEVFCRASSSLRVRASHFHVANR